MRLRPLDKDRRPDQLFSLTHFRFFSLLPSINGTHFRVLFLFVCCFANNGGANCPNNCECKWKSGKESVICTNLNLTIVPRNLESSTQVLDLTGNLIRAINKHEFYNLNLINLQKMYIAKCRLKTIDRYAFYKLINLVELDLSYNLLTFVPSASFEFINELRELRLSGNAITRLKSNAFLSVPQLVKLEMSACKINHIELNAFAGLENLLETLKLDNNRMVNVNSSAITRLINLNSLDLSNNHWNCTCQIKPLRLWLSKQNIPFSIPPKCHFPPRLTNRTWDKLDLDDFACKPRVRPLHATYAADETSNITLSCEYSGEPSPNITWAHRNKIIANSTSDKITVNQRLFNLRNLFNTSNLMILSSEVSDSGEYTCWAENRGGKAQASIGLSVIKTVQTTEKHSFIQSKIFVHALFITLLVILILLFVFIYILVFKNRVRLKSGPRLCNRPSENYDKIELNHCDDQVGPKPVLMMDQSRHSSHEQDKVRHPKLKQYISLSNPSDSRQSLSSPPEANFTLRMPYRGMSSFPESCLEGETLDSGRSELDRRVNGPIRNPESSSNRDDAIRSYYEENFGEVTLQHHVLRKEPIPTGSLYTTTKHSSKTFPDLLESSPPTTRSSGRRKNVYNTLPRMPCQSSQSSHSRSPLLPSSSQASSIENNSSASSRNHLMDLEMSNYHKRNFASSSVINSTSSLNLISVSEMNSGGGACYGGGAARSLFSDNPSLPTSPIRYRDPRADYALSKRHSSLSETPILDILEPAAAASMANRSASHTNQNNLTSAAASSRFSMIASTTYDYHAAQLERFLEEYRSLQVELTRMKASCDNFAKIIDTDDRKVLNSTEDIIESRSTKHNSAYQTMDPEPGPRSILKNKSSLNSLTQDSVYSQEKSHFLQEASNLDSASGWNSETSSQFARNLRGNDISNIYYDS